jgi:hypothetical protein
LLGVTPCDTNLGVSEHDRSPHDDPGAQPVRRRQCLSIRTCRSPHWSRIAGAPRGNASTAHLARPAAAAGGPFVATRRCRRATSRLQSTWLRATDPCLAPAWDCMFAAFDISHSELVAPATTPAWGTGWRTRPAGSHRATPLVLVGDGAFQMTAGNSATAGATAGSDRRRVQ